MEFKGIDLGDKRLNQRAVLLAEQLSGNPTASIPQACGGWAETAAAYRFFRARQAGMDRRHGAALAVLGRADAGMRRSAVPG